MSFWRKTITAFTLALLVLAVPSAALAASPEAPARDDKVVVGGTYTLKSGKTLSGNLVVLGGVVTLEADSIVDGDIIVFGGTVSIEGLVDGNLVAIGGVIDLDATAIVEGDMIAPRSVVRRSPEAQIEGQVITDIGFLNGEAYSFDEYQPVPATPIIGGAFLPVMEMLWFLFQTFFLSGLAVMTVVLVPKPIERTRDAVLLRPAVAGGLGVFTQAIFVATMIFLGLLSVLIITLPFTLLGMFITVLAFVIAVGLGWFALGLEIGKRVQVALRQDWTPALQAGFGTFILTFFVGSSGIILWSFVGWLFIFMIASVGLGGVLLTRFGLRDYEYTSPESMEEDEEKLSPVVVLSAETEAEDSAEEAE